MKLLIDNEQTAVILPKALIHLLETAIIRTLQEEHVTEDVEISMLIVEDQAIQAMNKTYRSKDRVTDVLSFPMFEADDVIKPGDLLGDIVIAASRASEQALEYGHSLEREMCFLTVHSMLHLLGYDHEISEEDEALMVEKQEKILTSMGLTRG
jgi:probable rRNA maturation factor